MLETSFAEIILINIIRISNAKISTHYQIIYLYSQYVCFFVFISNNFVNFFRNMPNSKTVKKITPLFETYKAVQ